MNSRLISCLVIFLFCCLDSTPLCANTRKIDTFTREYLSPVRIIWQSDTTGKYIFNSEKLLEQGNGQADLVGANLCVVKGGDKINSAILLDFGKEIHGGIQVVTGMHAENSPVRVKITLGESVSEAMSEVDRSTATNDHAIREYVVSLPWLGTIEIGNSGFRFAKIELLDQKRELKLKEVRAIAVQRDIPWLGSFKSSDERLNQIWQTGAYTVYLNMQHFLWDGIKRDRLVWVGDMHPEVMTILSVFGYNEVVPKSLDFIRNITKLPEYMNGISSYSMWWVLIHYQWYLNNGDLAYLQENQEYIYSLLDLLEKKMDADGKEKLDGMRFLDWPTSPNTEAIHAGLQSMLVMTFDAGQKIATILKNKEKTSQYSQTVQLLKKHVPDANNNKSGAALLALSGLEEAKATNKRLLAVNPTDGISSFYGYYVLQARAMAGDYEGALDVIRKYWGGMLDLGATTFWEDFDLKWMENAGRIDEITPTGKVDVHAQYGNYCYKGLRNSLCHGWASGPTAWLSQHVLGITVLEAGCRKIKIEPHLGDLKWVEGTYPTPYGVVYVRHEKRADGSMKTITKAPKGVTMVR
ncbi:MAG: alpha-L-rhamnosidase C-terminal domain-containing protein [Paludibacter sp.]|nr:alpha-L-rhamnosidase C-terminal domain-containing protein [Paludibacter sp.]